MKKRLGLLLAVAAVGIAAVPGCHRYCRPPAYTASAPPGCDPCPPGRLRPFHALTPRRYDVLPGPVPPARVDVLPPAAATLPGASPTVPAPAIPPAIAPPAAAPPPPPPPDVRGYGPPPVPPPEPSWRPSPDATPWPATPSPPRDPVRLYPPETAEPPQPPAKPDAKEERPPSPPLPVGILRFAMARPRVASGLRPSLEGLDWLKDNGYRTVLYIRRPGEDDATDRRQVESRRGMKYVSLELSPQNLREVVDQFNHLVGDAASQPLFVYDRDGTLQGFLWYLHFRIVDLAPDDEARLRAGWLGFREDGNPELREIWLAVQKYLSGR
ncbi:MAG TPA: hypothetical protein VNK04_15405 [Gemmataceae bacterium]|nr:hypothetical protein [Gemmataceae bacterium]